MFGAEMAGSKLFMSSLGMEMSMGQPEIAAAQLLLFGVGIGVKKIITHHREKKQRKEDQSQAQAQAQAQAESQAQQAQQEEQRRRQEEEAKRQEDQRASYEAAMEELEQRSRDNRARVQQQREEWQQQVEDARRQEDLQGVMRAQAFAQSEMSQEEAERQARIRNNSQLGHEVTPYVGEEYVGMLPYHRARGVEYDENGDPIPPDEEYKREHGWRMPPDGGGNGPNNGGGGNGGGGNGPNNGGFDGQGRPIGTNIQIGFRNPYEDLIFDLSKKIAERKNREKPTPVVDETQDDTQAPLGSDPSTWSPNGRDGNNPATQGNSYPGKDNAGTYQGESRPGENGSGTYKGESRPGENGSGTYKGKTDEFQQEDVKSSLLDNQHLTQQELEAILGAQGETELTLEDQLHQLNIIEQQLEILQSKDAKIAPSSMYSSVLKRM